MLEKAVSAWCTMRVESVTEEGMREDLVCRFREYAATFKSADAFCDGR